jgi:hypothetical protein
MNRPLPRGPFLGLLASLSLGLLLVLPGCDLVVEDLNNPSVSEITSAPTRLDIATSTQGLFRTTRTNAGEMVQWMGAFGREGYPMSQTGASLTGTVINPLNGANFPGTTLWEEPYRNIRNANLLLQSLENVTGRGLTDEEELGVRGTALTIQAYDYLNLILTRDRFGIPVDVDRDPNGDPAPLVGRDQVYQEVARLLDDAAGNLENAGDAFAFELPSGLSGFNTPGTFLTLNRALRARVAVYMEEWNVALDALEDSFLDASAPLDAGAYHVFSTQSGDATNPLNRPDFLYAHPRLRDDAALQGNGEIDRRAQEKLRDVQTLTVSGVTSDVQFTLYESPSAPIPWVKNEELILLRAEAYIGLEQYGSAETDINLVRTESGGLDPVTLTSDNAVDELLYNRLYSLMWEYGHAWIDARRYGRLGDLPTDNGDPYVTDAMPLPANECFPRDPTPEGCGTVPGL